jgi:hypothetical protein
MDGWLKQSTAISMRIGPFLDETTGKDAETGLTISQADVRLSKAGGDFAQKNEATSCTHDEIGYYICPLNTTDTDTLGLLKLAVHESGALPVWHTFMVLSANVYDSLVAGSDKLTVHADEITAGLITAAAIASSAITADKIATDAITNAKIAADAIGSSEFAQAAADKVWSTAARALTDKAGFSISGTKQTLDALNDITAASVWAVGTRALTDKAGFELAAAAIDAVWDELVTGHTTASSFAKLLIDNINATIGSRSSHAAADIWSVGTRALTDKAGFSISGTKQTLDALNDITAASVWAVATRALTDKDGFSISGTKQTLDALQDITAASVWAVGTRALTDKADFALSSASRDAIWDQGSALTLSFEALLTRLYQMVNNKMNVTEATGAVALRNIGDSADIATGEVTSASGTTTRDELTWA